MTWHNPTIIPQSSPVPKKNEVKKLNPLTMHPQIALPLADLWKIELLHHGIMEWDILGIALGISWTLFRYVGKKGFNLNDEVNTWIHQDLMMSECFLHFQVSTESSQTAVDVDGDDEDDD